MIGVTQGEYFGIGAETIAKTYADLKEGFPPCRIYGSAQLMGHQASQLGIEPFWEKEPFEFVETYKHQPKLGDTKSRAEFVLSTLDAAIEDANNEHVTALVTCPIDKKIVQYLIPNFTGHTEYLAEKSQVEKTVMLLNNKEFSIALLTNHVSLREVPNVLDSQRMETIIKIAAKAFQKQFHCKEPKMAVLGLNPHAGELDLKSEETQIMVPTIHKLRDQGMNIAGPFPADSFFAKARKEKWDLIFSPYHDQGLVAAKYNGIEKVINVTLGMPFLRVSPGHGVAYDLVGKGIANHESFKRALLAAQKHSLEV